MPTTTSSYTFTDGEALMYIGTLGDTRNVTEVVRKYFPQKESSIRSAISRDGSVQDLVDSGFLEEVDGGYRANQDKVGDFMVSLLDEPYDLQYQFRVEGEDREKIQNLFSREEVIQIFEKNELGELFDGSYSDLKRDISLLVKWIFLLLAVGKKMLEDKNIRDELVEEDHEEKIDILEEQIDDYLDRSEEMMKALYREEDTKDLRAYLEKVKIVGDIMVDSDTGGEEFMHSLPDFDVRKVNELFRSMKYFVDKSHEDIEEELRDNSSES